jgi:hypothetical protein
MDVFCCIVCVVLKKKALVEVGAVEVPDNHWRSKGTSGVMGAEAIPPQLKTPRRKTTLKKESVTGHQHFGKLNLRTTKRRKRFHFSFASFLFIFTPSLHLRRVSATEASQCLAVVEEVAAVEEAADVVDGLTCRGILVMNPMRVHQSCFP